MDNMKNYVKNNLLFLVLISQPLLDILAYFQEGGAVSLSGYIRLALTVCIPLYTLIKLKDKKRFFVIMCIIGAYCILHIANCFRVGYIDVFADIKYMLLVMHMPILLFSFVYLYDKKDNMSQISRALKVNAIIITAVFFLTYLLKSGKYTYQIYEQGWTGWYAIPNAQSVIMVSILPFIVYFLMKYCKKIFPIPMLAVIFMYIENGTKTAYYSLVLILVGYFCFILFEFIVKREEKLSLYTLSMLILLVVISIFSYNYSPRMELDFNEETARAEEQIELEEIEDEDSKEKVYIKYINKDLIARFGEERVLEAYGEDVNAYTFANMRLMKRIYGKLVWEDRDILTKLVGYEYSQMQYNDENFDLENDPPAILYYYGYLGAGMYICLLGYFVLRLMKQLLRAFKESLNLYNFAILISFGLQMGLAVYTGYLLRRPNVSIYLMVILLLIYCRTKSLGKGSET